ncbi:hypothetical protein [Rickettsia endosymbiont of Polydrusus tereticollis]
MTLQVSTQQRQAAPRYDIWVSMQQRLADMTPKRFRKTLKI